MARPQKIGLEYYPQDTNVFSDRKIRRLLNEFGTRGYTIYSYLLCLIYSDKGYYVQYDGGLAFDVSDFLKSGITEQLVNEVVTGCSRVGLFDERLFNVSKVLTSAGIQKRFLKVKKSGVIDDEMRVIDAITPKNDDEIEQSKVKESKEKEIKRKRVAFKTTLEPFLETYGKETLNDFFSYWTEPNPSLTKLRWELEKTWDVKLRLSKWKTNEPKFSPKNQFDKPLDDKAKKEIFG